MIEKGKDGASEEEKERQYEQRDKGKKKGSKRKREVMKGRTEN